MTPRVRDIFVGTFLLATSGCANVVFVEGRINEGPVAENRPKLETRATAVVGEAIYTSIKGITTKGAYATKSFILEREGFLTYRISEANFLHELQGNKGVFYCSSDRVAFDIFGPALPVCLVDKNNDGVFDSVYESPQRANRPAVFYNETFGVDVAIPYRKAERFLGTGGLKRELVYQGTENNVVRLSYREFQNNLARPAFTQELTYTLKPGFPATIQFRECRILISKIGDSRIEYAVLSGLE